MLISNRSLIRIVGTETLRNKRLSIGAALKVVQRHFCSAMTIANTCSTECDNCAERLKAAIGDMSVPPTGNTVGIAVYRLRNAVMTAVESRAKEQPETPKRSALGIEESDDTDAWSSLLEQIK